MIFLYTTNNKISRKQVASVGCFFLLCVKFSSYLSYDSYDHKCLCQTAIVNCFTWDLSAASEQHKTKNHDIHRTHLKPEQSIRFSFFFFFVQVNSPPTFHFYSSNAPSEFGIKRWKCDYADRFLKTREKNRASQFETEIRRNLRL